MFTLVKKESSLAGVLPTVNLHIMLPSPLKQAKVVGVRSRTRQQTQQR